MANLREIKNRVKSTQNTAKVTRAMQMVSAAKSKAASKEALQIAEFTNKIGEITSKLGIGSEKSNLKKTTKIGVVVVGPSRGFVGQLNNALYNTLNQFKLNNINVEIDGIGVQKYGAKIITQCGLPVKYNFEANIDNGNDSDLWPILTILQDKFESGEYSEIYFIYTRFFNLLRSEAVVEKILPIEIESESKTIDDSFLYEPDFETVINSLREKLFEAKLLSGILNSKASEHASRMVTMKNATENAVEMIGSLTQTLNKERQNKITQQIIEVASGGKNYEN